MTRYRVLDGSRIVETVQRLEQRTAERFPDSSLRGVVAQLRANAEAAIRGAPALGRPNLALRTAAALLAVLLVAGLVTVVASLRVAMRIETVTELIQTLEAGVNDVVFVAIAIWFLGTLEGRTKRRRALRALHELRSIAHIVDMHQLTKDPVYVLGPVTDTASSPRRPMSRMELERYLDYCSESLALTGKVAALYAQHFEDPVVLDAVNDVENLTTGLSSKIWQKISIIDRG